LIAGDTVTVAAEFEPEDHPDDHWSLEGRMLASPISVLDVVAEIPQGTSAAQAPRVIRDRLFPLAGSSPDWTGADVGDAIADNPELGLVIHDALVRFERWAVDPDTAASEADVAVVRDAITQVAEACPPRTRQKLLRIGRRVEHFAHTTLNEIETVRRLGLPRDRKAPDGS
jgi:hypothetical protein